MRQSTIIAIVTIANDLLYTVLYNSHYTSLAINLLLVNTLVHCVGVSRLYDYSLVCTLRGQCSMWNARLDYINEY